MTENQQAKEELPLRDSQKDENVDMGGVVEVEHQVDVKADFMWENLEIKARAKKDETEDKTILHSVNGKVSAGELCAILGASGAGKTTLLNRLSHKIESPNLKFEGKITLNNVELTDSQFKSLSCYVMQDDFLEPMMTPTEILLFNAKLRLDVSLEEIEERVYNMLKSLNLMKAKDTQIGDGIMRGVSGGERKRTSIGAELITDPKIIFLDEPTTGLDSYNSYELCLLLKKISRQGKIVIFTIHQPSSELFEVIDKINIMALGKTVYFGHKEGLMEHFENIKLPFPPRYNPFEHLIEMTNVTTADLPHVKEIYPQLEKFDTQEERYLQLVDILSARYNEVASKYMDVQSDQSKIPESYEETIQANNVGKNCFYVFFMLYLKFMLRMIRFPGGFVARVGQVIMTALMITLIYNDIGYDQASIFDRHGLVALIGMNAIFEAISSQVLIFTMDHKVYERERANKLYGLFPYYFAKMTIQLVITFITSGLFTLFSYYLTGLNDVSGHKFFQFTYICYLACIAGVSFASFLASLATSEEVLTNLLPLTVVPLMLLNSFFARPENFLPYMVPFKYISLFKYTFQSTAQLTYDNFRPLFCSIGNPEQNEKGCDPLKVITIDEPFWVNVMMLLILIAVYNIAALAMFKLKGRG